MRKLSVFCFFVVGISFFSTAQAAVSPLSVGLVPPIQFPPSDFTVTGARVSLLWGSHRDMYGIDIGALGNITDQRFVGTAISGVFNWTNGDTTVLGLQFAGLANINTNKTNVIGLQLAAGMNMNQGSSSVTGLQLALVNLAGHTNIYGAQVGLYNKALAVYGLQIGLVNVAKNLHGIQIGLVNFHREGVFVVSPIINVGF